MHAPMNKLKLIPSWMMKKKKTEILRMPRAEFQLQDQMTFQGKLHMENENLKFT